MKKLDSGLAEDIGEEIEQDELKGFARSVAEVEWLLLILVMLYLLAPTAPVEQRDHVIAILHNQPVLRHEYYSPGPG